MIGFTLEQKIMVLKVTSDINQGNENLQNSELQNKDEAAKLWEQYQKKKVNKSWALVFCILLL